MHPVRPPLEHRPVPEWRCTKLRHASEEAANAALSRIWSTPAMRGGGLIESHAYRCSRHGNAEVWHLTKQDPDGRSS